jgi:hypothetical protein
MGADAWGGVGDAMIARMGTAPDGKFSADRFVTAFGNMAPAARVEVFSSPQLKALTDLNTVSDLIKDRITRLSNPNGTGRTLLAGGALGAGEFLGATNGATIHSLPSPPRRSVRPASGQEPPALHHDTGARARPRKPKFRAPWA